ncbi:MAG: tRNA 4-thiouridine(8) synthase ThiI [Clostridia bacterium]|nr:tRNA 4-thiouridine(8) synthase ThiI [Clostridia bacterium]MBR6136093.1 tRNA 4-thiouridine(8) synthase ThiI [Clostridia bacterium]
MEKIILIRYGEIHLKGKNRPYFEKSLLRAIKASASRFGGEVSTEQGRYYVKGIPETSYSAALESLSKIFGIHSISPAYETDKDLESIYGLAGDVFEKKLEEMNRNEVSFKVISKRSDKKFSMNSMELSVEVGGVILDRFPSVHVDVHEPEVNLYVEIRDHAIVYTDIIPGSGGMPYGTSGKAMLLLSGGIDSPVAGYMMAKRGVALEAIHYHSFPYTSDRAKEKVIRLGELLAEYVGPIKIHMIHFTDIQMAIYDKCPEEQLTVLMRVFMMKIAERVAKENKCKALITGESLGQVASQTLDALNVTNSVVDLPVFRPLIGFDKLEIIDIAEKINTFETSILPYEDCCTVFVPKHPVTHPRLDKILKSLNLLDVDALIEDALSKSDYVIAGE